MDEAVRSNTVGEFRIERKRLLRAGNLDIFEKDENGDDLPDHTYMVVSTKLHYVQTRPHYDCDCGDFTFNDNLLCKHLLRALLHEYNAQVKYYAKNLDKL